MLNSIHFSRNHLALKLNFIVLTFFLMWTIFKVFIKFSSILLLLFTFFGYLVIRNVNFIFLTFFLMCTIFKVFINSVQYCFCCLQFLVTWWWGMWNLKLLNQGLNPYPGTGRQFYLKPLDCLKLNFKIKITSTW